MQDIITFLQQHLFLTSGIATTVVLLFIIELWRVRKTMGGLTPQAAIQLINHDDAVIIDIRDQEAFKKGHIVEARNLTAESVLNDKKIDKLKTKPLIIVCPNGFGAARVTDALNKKGFKAYTLQGGMKAWYDAKLPTIKEANHG